MKNFKVFVSLTLILSVLMYSFVQKEVVADATTEVVSFEQLKSIYGDHIEIEGNFSIDNATAVHFTTLQNPCAGVGEPCGAALAKARVDAQQYANDCCCVVTSGVQCCDVQQGALKAILFLVQPKSNCN